MPKGETTADRLVPVQGPNLSPSLQRFLGVFPLPWYKLTSSGRMFKVPSRSILVAVSPNVVIHCFFAIPIRGNGLTPCTCGLPPNPGVQSSGIDVPLNMCRLSLGYDYEVSRTELVSVRRFLLINPFLSLQELGKFHHSWRPLRVWLLVQWIHLRPADTRAAVWAARYPLPHLFVHENFGGVTGVLCQPGMHIPLSLGHAEGSTLRPVWIGPRIEPSDPSPSAGWHSLQVSA